MAAACILCQDPLVVTLDPPSDDEGPSSSSAALDTVPDDVELSCGDHFHWSCLIDAYTSPNCPACHTGISATSPAGAPQVLVTMVNEGGVQNNLDILPLLAEEAHLRENPRERRARAFTELCREGDVHAIVDLLRDCEEEDEDEEEEEGMKAAEVLRYQDPLGEYQSGLHAAVAAQQREVAWLLLLLASDMPELDFPALVYQEAAAMQIMRGPQTAGPDIRGLRDGMGRTAEDIAAQVGGVWHGWVGTGRLAI